MRILDNDMRGYDIIANILNEIEQHRKEYFNAMLSKNTEGKIYHLKAWYNLIQSKLSTEAQSKLKSFSYNVNQILNNINKLYYNESLADTVLDEYYRVMTEETETIFKMKKKSSISKSSITGYGESR